MTNYKNPDIRLEFTERMKKVKENIHPRLRRRDERECCWLNTVSNHGMNPFADVFEENPDEAYVINLANAIVRSWLVTEKVIYPHETIVGVVRPNYPAMEHFSSGIVIQYDDAMEKLGYCKEERERTKALSNRFMPHRSADLPSPSKKYGRELFDAIRSEQIFSEGYQGHTIPNYVTLFDLGLDGVLDKVNYWADKNVKDKDSADLYEAYRIIVCGMSAYLESYADYARKLFETEKDPTQKRYYAEIAENCDFVAHKKPVTLYQTIQLMWVLSLWDWVDCLGRVDQFLYPYYLYSKEHGDVITPEESITSLMFKIWEGGSHNSTLSGSKPEDGSDATNELSFLFLQVLRNIHDTHPRMVVRIREDVDPALMRLIVRLWSEGMSDPTVVSDTNVIPGLQRLGIPLEDARNYATLGCQEIEIPGKSNTGCEDGTFCIPKVLEIAMRGGMSTRAEFSGQIGPRTKTLSECETFEEFYASFEEQIKYFTEVHCYLASCTQMKRAVNHSKLVKGIFTDGVLESGKNHDDGGPIYGYGVMETAGLAAAADSLVAIKKLIFDDKTMTAEQLTDILAANFEGHEKERQYMLNRIPKFGNDDDEADAMAVRVLNTYWDELAKYKSVRGGVYTGACSLLTAGIDFGYHLGALPDGRPAHEPLGNTMGPRPGADKNGVTAMLRSVAKLPLHKGVGGTTLNVILNAKFMRTEEQRDNVCAIMKTFMNEGGQMAQITTASIEDLRDAQINPERHGNLIVRVGGYSIQFVQLWKEAQDEIIKRYEGM